MKINIYAVKDTVVGAMMNPFYMHNDEQAKRSFKNACNNEANEFAKIKKDLQLFKLGNYDDETGNIESKIVKTTAFA